MKPCVCLLAIAPLLGQETASLQSVKRIYIDGLGDKPQMSEIKKDLAADLRHSGAFDVADSAAHADATLTGHGDTWLKGYYSLNPRAGTAPSSGEAVYGGYLSVEIKDKAGMTLWSYLATPHGSSRNIARDLSKDVVKHLVTADSLHGKH